MSGPVPRGTTPKAKRVITGAVAILVVGLVAWAWKTLGPGQSCCPDAGAPALDEAISSVPDLTSDTLDNGIRYYVMPNVTRDNRVVLRLVVNAGSVNEEDGQRGLAHAVEHMAIRGSRRFPQRAVDSYVESLGMRRGVGVNGITTMDETVYRLMVPAYRSGTLDTAIAMLAGIASEALFDSAHARPEAGIIFEEWRSGRDAYQRAADERQALLLAGTPYESRAVIGDTSVLRRFDIAEMRRFYETWYRPERMAVVVVGDVDPDTVRQHLVNHFAGFKRRDGAALPAAPALHMPNTPLRATVVTDVEATEARLGIWYPRDAVGFTKRDNYRTSLLITLWETILYNRLDEVSLEAGSPLLSASVDYRTLARPFRAPVVGAVAMKGRALEALDAMTTEITRMARHGVSDEELASASATVWAQGKATLESGDNSEELAEELAQHFLTGNAALTRAMSFELMRDLLPTIKADDVKQYAEALSIGDGALVILAVPPDDSTVTATADEVVARVKQAIDRDPPPFRRAGVPKRLMATLPTPGKITGERKVEDAKAYEWILGNGMRVILKPTSFTFNEIHLRLTAPGGASLATDQEFPSAYLSDVIVNRTGVGEMTAAQLRKWLEPTSIGFSPTVSEDAVVLDGISEPADLEGLFQVLHLYMTSPREDTVAFDRYRERSRSLRGDRARDPDQFFADTLYSITTSHHPRARMSSSVSFADSAKLGTALDFWKARLSNAAGMTVVITGDFTLDRMRPLVMRYLASLPQGAKEEPRDVGIRFPAGVARHEVRFGTMESARTALAFSGPFDMTVDASGALATVVDLITLALEHRLRESLGATYSVDVRYEVDPLPPAQYALSIYFESSPERIEILSQAVLSELERLRQRGPTAEEFDATRQLRVRDYDGYLEDNEYWLGELSTHARFGWPLSDIAGHPNRLSAMTHAELTEMARRFIRTDAYVRLTMKPAR